MVSRVKDFWEIAANSPEFTEKKRVNVVQRLTLPALFLHERHSALPGLHRHPSPRD